MKAFTDRHGDIWVQTRAGSYRIAGSVRHAKWLSENTLVGSRLDTVERLYGPLSPLDERHDDE